MGFVIFLIILILAYLWIWPLVRVWLIRRAQRKMAEFFGFQGFPKDAPNPEPRRRPRRSGKKIDPSVGEYVEFEEIAVHTTEADTQTSVKYTVEDQITDVEWVDLPPTNPQE